MSYLINTNYTATKVDQRIRFLVLHYTELNLADSLKVLTAEKVSVHYVVPEEFIDGERCVYRLVDESLRASHAGVSYWQGKTNLNDTSIGIEIVNLGFVKEEGENPRLNQRRWIAFTDYQIETVIALAKDIIARYQIAPTCVVGHSDIAPDRKCDPGPLFPWKKLAEQGIGAWYDETAVQKALKNTTENAPINISQLQKNLKHYGYQITETGILDEQTRQVVAAFQMHFRPRDYAGVPDHETMLILESLINKYF